MKKKSLSARVTRFTLTPYSFWAALFIVVPLIFVAYYAFTDSDFNFTTENIMRFFTATSTVTDEQGNMAWTRAYFRSELTDIL